MALTYDGQKYNMTLNQNEIFGALFNMIISQEVFADNLKGTDLVDKARVDGSLYGDTKLYYSTDALESHEWGVHEGSVNRQGIAGEADNLLDTEYPDAPEVQAITLDKFRQIRLTVDDYLTKRAFMEPDSFWSFNSIMLDWMRGTKKVYDGTNYNVYIGTTESQANEAVVEVADVEGSSEGQAIAEALANLITDMTDYTRDYNDYGQLRRYSEDEIKIIFNSKFINKIKNIDLPVIFHNSGLEATFNKEVLPSRYFGEVNVDEKAGDGKTVRAITEMVLNTDGERKHYFAGDLIKVGHTAPAGMSYTEDANIIAKVLVKYPPYMSAFEVGTSFFNPRSLTENHYLTFGHNTIEYLKNYPLITVKKI